MDRLHDVGTTSPAVLFARARHFLVEGLWHQDFADRGWLGRLLGGLQLAALIGRGFVDDKLLLRASALTYMSSLAVVPFLVVLLSIIQWLGLSRDLVVLGVNQFLAGSPAAVERIMELVEGAHVGALGSAGGAIFLVTTVLSLRHVEDTFNEIWGALRGRSWLRRFTNYLAGLVIVPLAVGSVVSLSSDLGRPDLAAPVDLEPVLHVLGNVLLGAGPPVFLFVAFSLAYYLLPNTFVRLASALLGGAVAAALFVAAQYLYVSFSVGVARYNALFGGFAIVPLLLVWIYLSWAIVLLGAEIAYAHQHLARYRREARDLEMEPAEREAVGLRVALELVRAFRDGLGPRSAEWLSERLDSSLRVVSELLVRFERVGIASVCSRGDSDASFQLARPAESVRVGEVLGAIRGRRTGEPAAAARGEGVRGTVRDIEAVLAEAESALTAVRERSLASLLSDDPIRSSG
jgi:membrane protein